MFYLKNGLKKHFCYNQFLKFFMVCLVTVFKINGVANCLMPGERDYRFSRRTQPIGFDRHRRVYWFVARRIFMYVFFNSF